MKQPEARNQKPEGQKVRFGAVSDFCLLTTDFCVTGKEPGKRDVGGGCWPAHRIEVIEANMPSAMAEGSFNSGVHYEQH